VVHGDRDIGPSFHLWALPPPSKNHRAPSLNNVSWNTRENKEKLMCQPANCISTYQDYILFCKVVFE